MAAPPPAVHLRPAHAGDLDVLFHIQDDPAANDMAGTKPRTRAAFDAAWNRHLTDAAIHARVIELETPGGRPVVGSISCFQSEGRDCVGYWVAREWWGMGIASRALALFLDAEPRRPLHATTAATNAASRRILERCGFRCTGTRMGEETDRFTAREIAEFVLGGAAL